MRSGHHLVRAPLCLGALATTLLATPLLAPPAGAAPAAGKQGNAAKSEKESENEKEDSKRLTGHLEIKPKVLVVVNTIYASRLLLPGNFALLAVEPIIEGDQFLITPGNSTFGFTLEGLSYRGFDIGASLLLNLRTATPLASASVLSPQFYDLHIEARSDRVILRAGQYTDVVLPFATATTNGYPLTYSPGQLGYARPQLRADVRFPFGERFQLLSQASLSRPIQTFQVSEELLGGGAGIPDAQARLVLGAGRPTNDKNPWLRPYTLGVSGHVGRRRFATMGDAGLSFQEHNTWSIAADLRVKLPIGTTIELNAWRGSVLGDYSAGVFQTLSTELLEPVDARGFLAQARQPFTASWRANVGFGLDDPDNGHLGSGERTSNQAGFANVLFSWSEQFEFGLELSRWRTAYKDLGSTTAWRGELLVATHL